MLAVSQTFNQRVDSHGQFGNETAFSVEQTNAGYLIFSNAGYWDSISGINYSSVATITYVSDSGKVVSVNKFLKPYFSTLFGDANCSFSLSNGNIGIAGTELDTAGTQKTILYEVSTTGDSLAYHEYGTAGEIWIGRQGKQCIDGGVIIVGETSSISGTIDPFLLKIDSTGNQEWVKTYGDSTLNDYGRSVVQSADGGFFVGGRRNGPIDLDQVIFKTDSNGNTLWEQVYGSSGHQSHAQLADSANDHLIFASSTSNSQGTLNRLNVGKVNLNGTILWNRNYDVFASNSPAQLLSVKETPDSNIAVAGYSFINGFDDGVIGLMNQQGDSIWLRHYVYYDSLWTQGRGAFWDLIPTSDKGILAVGVAQPLSNNPNDSVGLYSQDTWIVKVDSIGCIVPGCDSLHTSITTQVTNLGDAIKVYPNPISSDEQIMVEIDIPEQFKSEVVYLTLLNSLGQQVNEMRVSNSRIEIPSPSDAGLYYLHLSSGSTWLSGKKIVVE